MLIILCYLCSRDGTKSFSPDAPDSITTYDIDAMGVHDTEGIPFMQDSMDFSDEFKKRSLHRFLYCQTS